MPDHAAFLKGINLGRRRISNDELRAHFQAIGLEDPAVFRASGNVVFSDPQRRREAELVSLIETELESLLGYPVATFVRPARRLLEIAWQQPFDASTTARLSGKLQVGMLATRPSAAARRAALGFAGGNDALALEQRELYWLPAAGISESSLDLKGLAGTLGPMTIRTMGTIEQIVAKHFAA
jgi:uncharacterized protein (DUF1697 family)